jgi:cytoskeleton protein RodZ
MTDPGTEPLSDAEVPSAPEAAPPADSPGAQLLGERRIQGLSLGDIARQLKLSVRQIEALERDDYANFSGPVFVRGFLRNYAKLLRLDPEPLLAAASLSAAPAAVQAATQAYVPVSATNPERRRKFVAWGAFVILAVLVLVLLASNVSKDRHETQGADAALSQAPSTPAATPQHADSPPATLSLGPAPSTAMEPAAKVPATAGPAAPPAEPSSLAVSRPAMPTIPAATTPGATAPNPPPAVQDPLAGATAPAATQATAPSPKPQLLVSGSGPSQIHMIFEGESWVEVKDGSGTTIFSRLNTAGTERVIKGTPPLMLVVGNAHGVKLMYRDKPVDLGPHTRVDVARITLE